MPSSAHDNEPQARRARAEELPGVQVEDDPDSGHVRLVFSIPDLSTALKLEWPSVAVLGGPALAIIISSIYQLITNGTQTAAHVTVLIFIAPVLLILAFVILYWRRKSQRMIELAPGLLKPGPWMLAQGGQHRFDRREIIRFEKVARRDSHTRLMPGHIVIETAFHRASFGGHLSDDDLEVLWAFVQQVVEMEPITIPWERMVTLSAVVGISTGTAVFLAVDAFLRIGPDPRIIHAFAGLTAGAVVFGLMLGAWRRRQPSIADRGDA